jgi:hypothetical protein
MDLNSRCEVVFCIKTSVDEVGLTGKVCSFDECQLYAFYFKLEPRNEGTSLKEISKFLGIYPAPSTTPGTQSIL